jgi:hypothetical protein
MAETIYAPWLKTQDPVERMEEYRVRLLDAVDEFVAAELAVRSSARRRNRALDLMRDLRFSMRQLAAQHGLPIPPTRFGRLLDELDDEKGT